MIGSLYVITNNITNKQYVGKTYGSIEYRWKHHYYKAINGKSKFQKAIVKYGKENFSINVIGTFEEGVLEAKEQELIQTLDTFNSGYNSTLGGDGTRYISISDSEIIDYFNSCKSIQITARDLHICNDSVRKVLLANNITDRFIGSGQWKKVVIEELNLDFNSLLECADFIIDCELTNTARNSVASSIGRAAVKERKTYLGLTFNFI